MSKLTAFASRKTGVSEKQLTTFGALLLALLPRHTQEAISAANDAARAVEQSVASGFKDPRKDTGI